MLCLEFESFDSIKNVPETSIDWQGELFGSKKKPVTTMKKRAADTDSPSNAGAIAFMTKSGTNLSQALRKKLKPNADVEQSSLSKKEEKSSSSATPKKR